MKLYPLTIIADRYHGSYSGGTYTAWNEEHYNVPDEIDEDDITCMEFWGDVPSRFKAIGKGKTPNDAVKDLTEKMGLPTE